MVIGVPKETASGEGRVGMTDVGVKKLVGNGKKVYVQRNAGLASGITDEMYEKAGAVLLDNLEPLYAYSDLIVKVKPPEKEELQYLTPNHIVFSYTLPERHELLTKTFMEKKVTVLGYEAVEDTYGKKTLLIPMSEIAGKMAVFTGAKLMQSVNGGVGSLLAFVPGIPPIEVLILGAGNAALGAAEVAAGLGCRVTMINRGMDRLREVKNIYGDKIAYLLLTGESLMSSILRADLIVNTIDLMGDKKNHLITRAMIQKMKKGSIIVDVACDQGGTIETSKLTTHNDASYVVDDIIHCAIPNLPGIVPKTATAALSAVTFPYVERIAQNGLKNILMSDAGFRRGLLFYKGLLIHKKTAENYGLLYTPLEKALD